MVKSRFFDHPMFSRDGETPNLGVSTGYKNEPTVLIRPYS